MQMGAALGMVAGYALKQRYVGFPVRGSPGKQAAKWSLG